MSRLPWPARLLVALTVPADRHDDVTGDLHVVHARRRARGAIRAWWTTSLDAIAVASAFLVYRWRGRARGSAGWFSWPEVRIAMRHLRRQPILTATAVVALAVGIGLTTVGYTFLDTMAYGQLPYPNGDRFVRIMAYGEPRGERFPVDVDRYRVFQQRADGLAHLGATWSTGFNVAFGADGSDVELLEGAWVTPASFAVLPVAPVLGRLLTRADDAAAEAVVVIRETLWQRRFGGGTDVIGRTIRIADGERTIVGVLPDDFLFPNSGEVWLPLSPSAIGGAWSAASRNPGIGLFGVLEPGVSLTEAREQLTTLSAGVASERREAEGVRIVVRGYTEPPGGIDVLMLAFVGVLILVLLVIASNVANLILVRTTARAEELAIRAALGAGRFRLVRQIAIEVLLMGALAAALGTAGAAPLLRYVRQSVEGLPFWIVIEPGPSTVVFVTAVTLLAAVVAGVVPALRVTRGDPAAALRNAAPGALPGIGRAGKAMITVEVALSVALLSVAIIMARGLDALVNPNLGIPKRQILTFWVNLNPGDDREVDTPLLRHEVLRAVADVPGVRAAGAGSTVPGLSPYPLSVEVEAAGDPIGPLPTPVADVSPEFFSPFGELEISGRLFTANDYRPGAAPVAVVTRPFVDRFLHGQNPLGRRLRLSSPDRDTTPAWREIVGVVPDLGMSVGDPELAGGVYLPDEETPWFYLAIRAGGNPMALVSPIRAAVAKAAPGVWLRHASLLEEVGEENRSFLAATSGSLTVVGVVALILSLAGVYAIMSLAVRRRTREIGLRIALGATNRQVLAKIFTSAAWYLGLGAVAGAGLGLLLLQARGIFTFRLEAPGPWIFGIVLGLVAVAGLAACWIPARRVLRIRPMEALKSE